MAFLKNQQTGKIVPTDWDTLDDDEKEVYQRGGAVYFVPLKHRNHGKTCTNPQRFFRRGRR